FLPDVAIDLIDEAGASFHLAKHKRRTVTPHDIEMIISKMTGVPTSKMGEDVREKLSELESDLKTLVIGQDHAVVQVVKAIKRSYAGLSAPHKPIASFLFSGPTGVGKTELAKSLADTLGIYFERFDMSEYMEKHALSRLIGAPPGYVGFEQGGLLSEAVRKHPYMVLLLDEIEKAHPDILNLFLQLMDDGRLTDAMGRTVDFTNVILIATSNAGTDFIQEQIKNNVAVATIQDVLVREKLKTYFKPEFINRFDGVIVFKPLTMAEITKIAQLMINKLVKQMLAKGIILRATDAAIQELSQKGFDPIFGARPLRRVIQENVNNALADFLLSGKIGRRDVVVLDKGNQIRIEKGSSI
ncbi:MAG: AAA family ATPase, partial [Patescibacteria group bacterium]|nr:AAA family ATPase [Patescibacteria group bacterium]